MRWGCGVRFIVGDHVEGRPVCDAGRVVHRVGAGVPHHVNVHAVLARARAARVRSVNSERDLHAWPGRQHA